ncbi:hypothetical protein AA18890_2699 [Komagataeibacter europaeus LMG 18890]|nr:hypothetical protein AA18890_2699 [Komagataeibacter europaeus LMG 18890]
MARPPLKSRKDRVDPAEALRLVQGVTADAGHTGPNAATAPATAPVKATEPTPAPVPRPDPIKVVQRVNPEARPVPAPPREKSINLNIRVRPRTIRSLGTVAEQQGTTTKNVVMKALADAGIEVDELDLVDRRTVPWHQREG